MNVVRAAGVAEILLGLFSFLIPFKFYSFAMKLFTPDVSPPFSMEAVLYTTLVLALPGVVLLINGAALLAISASSPAAGSAPNPSEGGVRAIESPAYVRTRHEILGKEVYDRKGRYYGRVVDAELSQEGEVVSFKTRRSGKSFSFSAEQIESSDEVILVRV
ncbi:MAG: hypothetical protein GXN98_01760 [Euryarchaeota archaeon]|nr:hypothetical protein [Euryarchaeota archaeon]